MFVIIWFAVSVNAYNQYFYTDVSAITHLPWMFLSMWLDWEYRIGLFIMEHHVIGFTLQTRTICMAAPGFVTDCLCGVWSRGATIYLLYVGPLFYTCILKGLVCKFDIVINSYYPFRVHNDWYILLTKHFRLFHVHLSNRFNSFIYCVLQFTIDVFRNLSKWYDKCGDDRRGTLYVIYFVSYTAWCFKRIDKS